MSPWLPWAYQYLVGGFVFIAGLSLVWKAGLLRSDRRSERWTAAAVTGALAFAATIHAVWILRVAG